MLLLKGESIFWSIPVEFKYYFISPLIIWVCHKHLKWNQVKLIGLFTLIIISTIAIELIYQLPITSTLRYFPIFIVGTIISIFELLNTKKLKTNKYSIAYSIGGIISIICIGISIPFYFQYIFGYYIDFHRSEFYLPYAMLWGIILLSAKYGNRLLKKILEIKVLRFIGSISFSIYIFHMVFLQFVSQLNIANYIKIYLFLFLTILFSSISYILIERPLSRIRIRN